MLDHKFAVLSYASLKSIHRLLQKLICLPALSASCFKVNSWSVVAHFLLNSLWYSSTVSSEYVVIQFLIVLDITLYDVFRSVIFLVVAGHYDFRLAYYYNNSFFPVILNRFLLPSFLYQLMYCNSSILYTLLKAFRGDAVFYCCYIICYLFNISNCFGSWCRSFSFILNRLSRDSFQVLRISCSQDISLPSLFLSNVEVLGPKPAYVCWLILEVHCAPMCSCSFRPYLFSFCLLV